LLSRPFLKVVQNVQHAHQEGTGAAGRVYHGDLPQLLGENRPELFPSRRLIGVRFFFRLQGEYDLIKQVLPFPAQGVGQAIH